MDIPIINYLFFINTYETNLMEQGYFCTAVYLWLYFSNYIVDVV
jgi:hypothetical protein